MTKEMESLEKRIKEIEEEKKKIRDIMEEEDEANRVKRNKHIDKIDQKDNERIKLNQRLAFLNILKKEFNEMQRSIFERMVGNIQDFKGIPYDVIYDKATQAAKNFIKEKHGEDMY